MIHINRFIDKIKMLESKQSKDFTMTMREAKDLHGDITKLLLAVYELQSKAAQAEQVQKVELDGGSF